ncbi:AAA family ATPase [Deinococcus sp. SDU3-2]|uniref:AAA family ATPase n=1 Tax=Deinococcus terrestris TaxID=2651870 RepID=A0A7X1NUE4_9DEIO|nr:AAA family ATPase [Deinococcus terrestris]MPY65993.1 AAA family ATPase [Deinococcus terrestris]
MASFLYLLVGPPGSGKRTVGTHLSRLTGAPLLDNHLTNDPVFHAFGLDGVRPVPPEAWPFASQVRAVVREAVAASPRGLSHIFTVYLADQPGEAEALERFRALAAGRGATFVPVWLTCPTDELARRAALPERSVGRLKLRDPEGVRRIVEENGLLAPPPGAIVLDTAQLTPANAALLIAAHAGALF